MALAAGVACSVRRTVVLVKLPAPAVIAADQKRSWLIELRPAPALPPEAASVTSTCTATVPPALVVGLTSSSILKPPAPTGNAYVLATAKLAGSVRASGPRT